MKIQHIALAASLPAALASRAQARNKYGLESFWCPEAKPGDGGVPPSVAWGDYGPGVNTYCAIYPQGHNQNTADPVTQRLFALCPPSQAPKGYIPTLSCGEPKSLLTCPDLYDNCANNLHPTEIANATNPGTDGVAKLYAVLVDPSDPDQKCLIDNFPMAYAGAQQSPQSVPPTKTAPSHTQPPKASATATGSASRFQRVNGLAPVIGAAAVGIVGLL